MAFDPYQRRRFAVCGARALKRPGVTFSSFELPFRQRYSGKGSVGRVFRYRAPPKQIQCTETRPREGFASKHLPKEPGVNRTLYLLLQFPSRVRPPRCSTVPVDGAQKRAREETTKEQFFPFDRYLLYLSIVHSWNRAEPRIPPPSKSYDRRSRQDPPTELSPDLSKGTLGPPPPLSPSLCFPSTPVSMQIPSSPGLLGPAESTIEGDAERERKRRGAQTGKARGRGTAPTTEQTAGKTERRTGEEGSRLATGVNSHGSGRTTTTTPAIFFSDPFAAHTRYADTRARALFRESRRPTRTSGQEIARIMRELCNRDEKWASRVGKPLRVGGNRGECRETGRKISLEALFLASSAVGSLHRSPSRITSVGGRVSRSR